MFFVDGIIFHNVDGSTVLYSTIVEYIMFRVPHMYKLCIKKMTHAYKCKIRTKWRTVITTLYLIKMT